jgi:hypothetical protein
MHSPTQDEFLKRAAQGNVIPVNRRSIESKAEMFKTTGPQSLTPDQMSKKKAKINQLILLVMAMTVALIGCKTSSQSGISDEQKQLITLAKALPTSSPLDGQTFLSAGLDSKTKTVLELVDIFMTNRDWTESLPQKQLDAWKKRHPYDDPPVIIHEKQSDAASQLIQLGVQAKVAAPAMIQSLTNSEFLTRQWASGQKSTDLSYADIADSDLKNRDWAIRVLEAIGSASPEVVPALVRELDDGQRGYEAGYALITISLTDTNVLPAVIAKLETDPTSPEAKNSVQVLDGIGADARAAVPVLIQLLENTNACDEVVDTLCTIGPDAAPAVPSLLRLYERSQGDGMFRQRKWIVITLGKIGPAAKEAVPILLKQLRPHEALDASRALWRIDPQQYTQNAINVALHENQRKPIRFWDTDAIALLGQIGPPAKYTASLLQQVLDSPPNQWIAFNAAWALWRIDPSQKEKVIAVFEDLRNHGGDDLPLDAVGALWQIEPERRDELLPAIIAIVKDGKVAPGWAEMKTLQPALMEIADDPKYAELRPQVVLALRQINRARAEWWPR